MRKNDVSTDSHRAQDVSCSFGAGVTRACWNRKFFMKNESASGSLQSTGCDLGRWPQIQLSFFSETKRPHKPRLTIPNDGREEMQNPQTIPMSCGLGWVIHQHDGEAIVYHHKKNAGTC
jgi:hypothetical protein